MPRHRAALVALVLGLCRTTLVNGQSTTARCSPDFSWASNSLGQSPCKVAAYLGSECSSGYLITPLTNGSDASTYHTSSPPTRCECNTIMYSVLAACTACQGFPLDSWHDYSANCSSTTTSYPLPLSPDTRIPAWATQNVTGSRDQTFNVTLANLVGDSPEVSPALSNNDPTSNISSLPSSSSVSSDSVPTSSSSPTSESNHHGLSPGIIAGVTVGGIALLFGICGFVYCITRKTRLRPNLRLRQRRNESNDSLHTSRMRAPRPGPQTLEDEDTNMTIVSSTEGERVGSSLAHPSFPFTNHHMSLSTANATLGGSYMPARAIYAPPYSPTTSGSRSVVGTSIAVGYHGDGHR